MLRTGSLSLLSLLLIGTILADETQNETKVSPKTEAVALFKNGYTVVRQEMDVPSGGIYRWEDVPAVIHGTFFIESDLNVEVRTTQRFVSVPVDAENPPQSIADLIGKTVSVHLATPTLEKTITGRIVDTAPAAELNSLLPELARSANQPRFNVYSPSSVIPSGAAPPVLSTPIVLKDDRADSYWFLTGQHISSIIAEPITERTERRPVMLFRVTNEGTGGGKIRLFYLTKGATWAPSYRIDLLDDKRLRLEQATVIRNEGLPIIDTDISLVSGFPQIETANVLSPLTPSQTLAQFFQQILSRGTGHGADPMLFNQGMITNQMVMSPRAIENAGFDTTALAAGEGPDIHYNSIGKRSLDTGDTLSLTVGKGEADYRRVLECDLSPQMLNHYAAIIRNVNVHNWQAFNNQIITPEVFEVLKFQNPLKFPMTTAPAMVTEKSRFLGQSQTYWVNPQQVASIKVTKAMNLAVTYSEKAEDLELLNANPQMFRNASYVKRRVTGTVEIVNRRNEEVTLHVDGLYLGTPEKIEPAPTKETRSTRDYYPNDVSDLFWELTLQPGESKTMTITGTRWFRM